MTFSSRSRPGRVLAAAVAALVLAASVAEARPGRGGGGFGSRGARTYQAPPATATSPRAAAPIERSAVPQGQPGRPAVGQAGAPRPGGVATPARGGFFGRNGGLMGGLLGAGLVGMLLGYGLFGGLGGLGSILGLLLQVALVVILARLAWRFFQRRSQPALAGAGAPLHREAPPPSPPRGYGGGAAAPAGAAGPRPAAASRAGRDEVGIGQADLNEFERLLGEVQGAYGREDAAGLRAATTPEMAAYFEAELDENARRGVANRVGDVRLLQGDLAEAWREGGSEYATVAMRFSLTDHTVDRATGRTVEGDPARPTEATEVWTFVRPRGGRWLVSAIQQG